MPPRWNPGCVSKTPFLSHGRVIVVSRPHNCITTASEPPNGARDPLDRASGLPGDEYLFADPLDGYCVRVGIR